MSTDNTVKQRASLFDSDGVLKMSQAIPLALRRVVTMIVGCMTPTIIISGAADVDTTDRALPIQASLVVSALTILLQFFPLGNKNGFHLGSSFLIILGISFAYVPGIRATMERSDTSAILGARIIGGVCAILVGLIIKRIREFFPPLIAGTVVFTIGLSLYSAAINYMTDGTGQPTYGAWQDWVVAIFTLMIVTVLNHFTRGFLGLTPILVGVIAGYIFSVFFGIVSFGNVAESGMFQSPQVVHFGINFEASICVALGLLLVINSVQAISDFSVTTAGGLDRRPTTNELHDTTLGYGFSSIIDAFLRCLPTATYSRNIGIVTTTKVVNRVALGLSALIMLVAGLFPRFSALLTIIPYTVLSGATVSIFASIAMTGMELVMTEGMSYHNTSIVGLATALGMGVSQASASLSAFPTRVTTVFGKSPAIIATLAATLLNVTLPKGTRKAEKN